MHDTIVPIIFIIILGIIGTIVAYKEENKKKCKENFPDPKNAAIKWYGYSILTEEQVDKKIHELEKRIMSKCKCKEYDEENVW